jgi:XRE family transcriptional regulator of biofilm formation
MIGDYIRKIRLERNISIAELSKRTGVSKSYLSNLERNNQKNPGIEVIKKISSVLDIPPTIMLNNGLTTEIIEEIESAETNTYIPSEFFFQVKKQIEELETHQLEDLKNFIEFILWKRK